MKSSNFDQFFVSNFITQVLCVLPGAFRVLSVGPRWAILSPCCRRTRRCCATQLSASPRRSWRHMSRPWLWQMRAMWTATCISHAHICICTYITYIYICICLITIYQYMYGIEYTSMGDMLEIMWSFWEKRRLRYFAVASFQQRTRVILDDHSGMSQHVCESCH